MGTNTKGMVQVSGTTYRIVERGRFYEVVRLFDDRMVGSFRCGMGIELLHSGISAETLREIVRDAQRSARLSWAPRRDESIFRLFPRHIATGWNRLIAALRSAFRADARDFPLPIPMNRRRGRSFGQAGALHALDGEAPKMKGIACTR